MTRKPLMSIIAAACVVVLGACATPTQEPRVAASDFVPTMIAEVGSIGSDVLVLPSPEGLIEVALDTNGAELPESKDDGSLPVDAIITSNGVALETFATIKVQGSSTAGWPKKNWTLRLYSDAAREDELSLKIGHSIPSSHWVLKAEWIDPTQIRNLLSYRLWEDMVDSRPGRTKHEVQRSGGEAIPGAQGFPRTYLSEVAVNGDHYGLATLTMGHDPGNFAIDADNPEHMYMEFDARGGDTSEKTWAKFSAEGAAEHLSSYLSEDGSFTDDELEAIDRLGSVINGSPAYFAQNFDTYFDRENMVDMLLFLEMIYDWDAVAQDIEIVSYDQSKWYFLPWDKDTTFGMYWDGGGIVEDSENKLLLSYGAENSSQRPWLRVYETFPDEVEARYAQLRRKGVFSEDNLAGHIDDLYQRIRPDLWEAEEARWAEQGRLSLEETNETQILTWFSGRLETLDGHFGYVDAART